MSMASNLSDVLEVTLRIAETFESLEIPYLIGGSLASSLHGIPRATQDVDVVAEIRGRHVSPLVSALEDEFYVDQEMIRSAISRRSSFNVIHLTSMFKVDVFVLGDDVFFEEEMKRRRQYEVSSDPPRTLVVASPEDVLLHKLYWFRQSNEASDRQWRDVRGIVKVQGEQLDEKYLSRMAEHLNVEELLDRALSDD
jgi:hypothetical protein